MANIQAELAAIMAAIYGEEVRGSIHSAIKKINDVSEVVLTTGTAIDSPTSPTTGFFDGSLYLNTNTNELWKCTGSAWASQGFLKGEKGDKGDDGNDGKDGENGNRWFRGLQVSASSLTALIDANENDNYLNTAEGKIYHCIIAGNPSTWVYDMTLTGGGGGGGGASALVDLDDVTISGAVNGQGLVYEDGVWKNKNVASDVNVDGITITKNGNVLTLSDSAKTSLGKADTAYQKPSSGIPQSDLASEINEKLSKLDSNGQLPFDDVTDKPTTLSGYGITNTYTKTEVDNKLDGWFSQTPQATATGDQTIVFTELDTSKAYELWFETSNGSQVTIKSSTLSETTLSYVVSIPSDCPVPVNFKLRVIN